MTVRRIFSYRSVEDCITAVRENGAGTDSGAGWDCGVALSSVSAGPAPVLIALLAVGKVMGCVGDDWVGGGCRSCWYGLSGAA